MRRVFVSGCFDVLHGGHVTFFEDARALGDHLTVSVATDEVLRMAKGRQSTIPFDNKVRIIGALRSVDRVVGSSNLDPVFDFRDSILGGDFHILAVTEDDRHKVEKLEFCAVHNLEFAVLPKRHVGTAVSTTSILTAVRDETGVPLRVDFAGGWLDVPRFARDGNYVVNCAIQPLVTLKNWPYHFGGGLGGSAAQAILEARNGFRSELQAGVGWQDPAIIAEGGVCVWRSGERPILELKTNPEWLAGRMLLFWTGQAHDSRSFVDRPRNYDRVAAAGKIAKLAVERRDVSGLMEAVRCSYEAQIEEGMSTLPPMGSAAVKYLGSGHGGYALCLFAMASARDEFRGADFTVIEPYLKVPQTGGCD